MTAARCPPPAAIPLVNLDGLRREAQDAVEKAMLRVQIALTKETLEAEDLELIASHLRDAWTPIDCQHDLLADMKMIDLALPRR